MKCPKCGKRMTLTEGGWTHIYNLSQYMNKGKELCTYIVKETVSPLIIPRMRQEQGRSGRR